MKTGIEGLGSFYLGKGYDLESRKPTDDLLLYDAKDLTTHGVCLGMTGSGKTGLAIGLLEEAALDGVPVIAIDPKGDMGNLALTFPRLRPGDFRPWIDESAAARRGETPDEHAQTVANRWREGLASWGQSGERIARLKKSSQVDIYTPGSNAGIPLTVLRSFDAPPPAILEDEDALRDRTSTAVSGLLGLIGIDADPIQSREHILLSHILDRAWRDGKSLDIAALIAAVQAPGFNRVGVFDLESFFPGKERFALAMRLNNLLASPGFRTWMEGEPLDIRRLFHTAEGRPKLSILSIAHLPEKERMFFVTIFLNELIAWMRQQPGTGSLRALLYMDEIFGYFPPTAEPPSKRPMLTLLKQARAYGLGILLSSQNPVDLDYKGLSNTGTWFIGRLQTERDRDRVLSGLEGAAASSGGRFDRPRLEKLLAGLDSRVFLMNNVHDDAPTLFHTRWAMSYLRGPMTREEIKTLTRRRRRSDGRPAAPATPPRSAGPRSAGPRSAGPRRPATPRGVKQRFLAAQRPPSAAERLLYRPALYLSAALHFKNTRAKTDVWSEAIFLADLDEKSRAKFDWKNAARLTESPDLEKTGGAEVTFTALPDGLSAKRLGSWQKQLKSYLYRNETVNVWRARELKQVSEPGMTEGEFRIQLREALRTGRDLKMAKLQKKFTPKLARLEERVRKAKERIGREQSQYEGKKMQTMVSIGATILGALFGRKMASRGNIGRAATAARGAGRAARERDDIARAERDLAVQSQKLVDLEAAFEEAAQEIVDNLDVDSIELEATAIRPRKSDISITSPVIVWMPWLIDENGIAEVAATVDYSAPVE